MKKYRFLIFRRVIQIAILATFAICASNSYRIFEGNLSQSTIFYAVPMSDLLSIAQIFFAGGAIATEAFLGFLVVLFIYGVFLGRGYCAFVCPMNIVTDFANFIRRIFSQNNASKKLNVARKAKYGVLILSLILSFILATPAFDLISPISMLHRGIIFGMGFGIFGILCVFLFDLFFVKNGFCGYICPLGAVYGLVGKFSLLKIAHNHEKCTKCDKCIIICPESQVLDLIGTKSGTVNGVDCIKCGRCVEVCEDNALKFGIYDLFKGGSK